MGLKFNPFTGTLDEVGAGSTTTPGGSDTEIQYNDSGSFAGSADLTWDDTGKVLGVGGDIDLDDGGTYTTTLQTITPTAARTISFPDATGTVALVGGSSGQLVYNNAGAQAGAPGSVVGSTGNITLSLNGALSATGIAGVPVAVTGTWIATGGTATTTKPQVLIEPTGATSTAWSTSGTGLGVNAASGFAGNLLDLQVNGTHKFKIQSNGVAVAESFQVSTGTGYGLYWTASTTFNNRADGVLTISNYAENDFGRLQFGGTTTSFPALKRNSAVLETKLADDSAYARHAASVFQAATAHTVATLPGTPAVGMIARVTDATAPAVGSTVAGGGAAAALCWYNGANWSVIGV